MNGQLEEMRIRPAENGGHTVVHEFKRKPVKRGGSMSGGIYNERPPSEEHVFGPGDGDKLEAHVSKHLGLKGAVAAAEKEEDV
jgi:hypothetical protein